MDVNEADNKEHFLGKCIRSRERKNNTSGGKILIAVFVMITRICSGLRNLQFVPLPVSRSVSSYQPITTKSTPCSSFSSSHVLLEKMTNSMLNKA